MKVNVVNPEWKVQPGEKPAHSEDGRKQLCYRCGKYCSRTKNMCPTCHPRKPAFVVAWYGNHLTVQDRNGKIVERWDNILQRSDAEQRNALKVAYAAASVRSRIPLPEYRTAMKSEFGAI